MVGPRVLSTVVFVAASSACSFLAFDDYSGEPNVSSSIDASPDRPSVSPPPDAHADVGPTNEAGMTDPYGDAVRADGPVAWYRFEEDGLANAAKDSAGNLTAELRGGAMGFGGQGISGKGLFASGSGGGFTLGDNHGFAGQASFSLEVWVKPSSGKEHYLFNRRTTVDGSLSGWILYVSPSGTPHFESWGTKIAAWSPKPIPAGWVHLVATVSFTGGFGTGKLWINGQPAAESEGDPDATTPEQTTSLDVLSVFEGEADELAIYDKALSSERVLAHYVAGKP